jgi:hypothetical protein
MPVPPPTPARRLRYSNVVATLALFVALGGSAVAVTNAIRGKEIKKRSIPANRVKKNTLGGSEIDELKLGEVPRAAAAGDAETLAGSSPGSFLSPDRPLASGRTMTGAFSASVFEWDSPDQPHTANAYSVVSFPVPAPVALTDNAVNFAPTDPAATGDEDPRCNGSAASPTAPPGLVCLYATRFSNVSPGGAVANSVDESRFGFAVQASSPSEPLSNINVFARGTWAYTAP